MKKSIYTILCSLMLLLMSVSTYAQTTINGTVKDQTGGLAFANVFIEGTTSGTTTDVNGNFKLKSNEPLPWKLVVSYIGYKDKTVEITDANKARVNIEMKPGGVLLDGDVIISASRKREKVQEAPASVSVISAQKLAASANATDPTRNLISTPGVQIQQQSANRINISMRGGAGLFGTSVFPIMDYRSLVGPGIGTFQSDGAGLSNIDLQRIEVVRGPGSALYGPGVTQGVVHFITKNPIDFPGTTVELMGGELNTFGTALRHATKVSDKFGFKINAQFRRGDEFTLDPNDPDDALQIAKMTTTGIFQPGVSPEGFVDPTLPAEQLFTFEDLDPDGDGNPMQNDWSNSAINATLEFRPKDNLGITVAGGFNQASSVFYNEQGEGLAQATEFWGQARMQAGGLFAQVFAVTNDGGSKERPTFLYQTASRSPIGRQQLEAQVQYNFDTKSFLNSNWTVGTDYRFAGQDTENLVYGRNEEDDSYLVYGAYVQGKLELTSKLDAVLAARYDQFNFINEGAFSPRAALVYKIDPKHTVRASYNRSNTTVSNLQLNIDFPLSTIIPGGFDVWLHGNKEIRAFGDNPMIEWFNPDIPAVPIGAPGLPTAVPYASVAAPTNAAIIAGLMADPMTAPLVPIIEAVLAGIDPTALGFTGALSSGFNIFNGSPLSPIDAPISRISTEDVFEVGYKGLIAQKLGVTFDVYRVTQRNNSQFTAISPAYVFSGVEDLPGDLGTAVSGAIAEPLVQALIANAGMPEAQARATADALLPVIAGAYTQGGSAFIGTPLFEGGPNLEQLIAALPFHATVPTIGTPDNGVTHLTAGYRTFDERTFYGADLGLEYFVNDDISIFGNYSWIDTNQFLQNVVGVEGSPLATYLNIPKNKFRLGVNYTPELGLRGNISFQHDEPYFADAGQFSTDIQNGGKTDPRNLVDAAVGYKFDFGLAIDLTATNVLDTEYRYLPNMPKIGRRFLAKLTYTIGENK